MKTLKQMAVIAAAALTAVSCGQKGEAQKVLVLYYSQTSNTKIVAENIATRLGADIEEIVPVKPYDGDFQATIGRCMEERQQGIVTEIQPVAADLSQYDVIFIGYPIWFGTFAPPMATFLSTADLSGKKIVPFCTFGSGGLESSIKDLQAKQPNAEILPGYGVRAARMAAAPKEIETFLMAGGFIEGEYTAPADFPEQHEVSAEEAAIFDTAVGDYPMINAQAQTVAVRTVPEGVEYMFTAVDKPRMEGHIVVSDDKPKLPPAASMTIYVLVADGGTPEFTRVVR